MTETDRLSGRKARFLAALLTARSIRNAAQVAGVSEPTAFRYLQDPAVKTELHARQDALLVAVGAGLAADMGLARGVLVQVMADTTVGPGVRVMAARAIIDAGLRILELASLSERIAALEASQLAGVGQ